VDDVELFQNIISDLFPGVVVPDQDHGDLEKAVLHVLEARGLQAPHTYVTKVCAGAEVRQGERSGRGLIPG
jgi:dynein heavy chain, axonemal